MREVVEEIDFVAEHPKADMSKVNTIIVNGKKYVSFDQTLEIIDKVSHKTSIKGEFWTAEKTIKVLRRDILALFERR